MILLVQKTFPGCLFLKIKATKTIKIIGGKIYEQKKALGKDELKKVAGGNDGRNSAGMVGLTYGDKEPTKDGPHYIETVATDQSFDDGAKAEIKPFHFSSGSSATQQ